MKNCTIRAIIWDVGNIFVTFDYSRACKKLALHSKKSAEDIYTTLFSGDKTLTKLHDSGQITSQDFFLKIKDVLNLSDNLSFEEFCDIWKDIFQENKEILEVFGALNPSIKMCTLSNTDPIHWSAVDELSVIKKYFPDESLLTRSYTSGVSKPEVKIYQDAIACLGLKEENIGDIIYIEDVPEYRNVFENMGGNTISYDYSKDTIEVLKDGLRKFGLL
jgi:FMN phosphatase YigB (HAD superfamily)